VALSFLGGSLGEILGGKKHERAIAQLRAEIRSAPKDTRTRLQLADLLVEAGRAKEAVPVLLKLAEEFAREGAAAKAISVLKRAQKAAPGREDIAAALKKIVQKTASSAPAHAAPTRTVLKPVPSATGGVEFEMEEISLDVRVAPPIPDPVPEPEPPRAAPLPPPPTVSAPVQTAAPTKPVPPPATVSVQQAPVAAPLPPPPAVIAAAEPDGPGLLDDLLDTIEDVLAEAVPAKPAAPAAVASPLFSEFSQEDLAAVVAGLNLQTFEPGDILITEGEPGDSLFVVTSGEVKAFVKQKTGRHRFVRSMGEGSFFGEISILTGKPRTATVTAKTAVDALILDRATLDSICQTRPGVLATLQRFADERQQNR
jgi:hypothetical protein